MKTLLLAPCLLLLAPLVPSAVDEDRAGVEDAILDYVEGIYEATPERIERSVSAELVKYGYWSEGEGQPYHGSAMNFDQLVKLASEWNADGSRANDESPKEIDIYDVLDKTASAKLTAEWGIDYFQLEKVEDKWMIRHALWQSHP